MVAAAQQTSPVSIVLLQMGGPDSLDAVEPFLFNLFRDNDLIPLPLGFLWQKRFARLVSRRRAQVVRDYYQQIGGRSPIGEITRGQADALEQRLNAKAPGRYRCHVAMRYSPPFTPDALRDVAAAGSRTVIGLSLYPHYTTATTGSSFWELRRGLCGKPPAVGAVDYHEIDRWPDEPLYLDALTQQIRKGLAVFEDVSKVRLLFSAHGLPETFINKGDPYVTDLMRTIAGVMQRIGGTIQWSICFQSRAGNQKWLEPSTEDMLKTLAKAGQRDVLVVPISFVSDHIETLYEIDLLFGGEAKELGLNFHRAPSLNTDPLFIEALATLVERKMRSL